MYLMVSNLTTFFFYLKSSFASKHLSKFSGALNFFLVCLNSSFFNSSFPEATAYILK